MIGLLLLVLAQGWQPCAPMPTPGYGFACAAVGSRVYAIGGLIASDSARHATEAYDVAADSWVRGLAPMPGPRWYAGCAALDGKIYVMGGTPDGHSDLSRVDRYDPSSNTWDTVAPLPWPRSALAGCTYGGCIYAIGGVSASTYQRTVARFTPDSGAGRWDVVESLVTRRASLAAAVAAGKMCAVGGQYYGDLSSFETYQPGTEWSESTRLMHHARSGAAAVGRGPWLCAIGGQNHFRPMSSVEIVNVDSGPWRDTTPLSVERALFGAAVADSFVVVVGGLNSYGASEASVEKNSSLFPPGIEEPETEAPVKIALRWATVASNRVRINCRSAAIYDGCGRCIFAGSGPVNLQLAPGAYFARVKDVDNQTVSGRITIVR